METELKLALSAEGAAALAASPLVQAGEDAGTRRLVSRYFDTDDGMLRRAGLTLRIRADGTDRLQTVKAEGAGAAGLFARPEWEQAITGEEPVIDAGAGPVAALLGGRALRAAFVTDILRIERTIAWLGARITLAIDTGEVRAGGRARPLGELELELKDGPIAALFDLARALDAVTPLRLGVRSKSERGFRLADGLLEAAAKADPLALDPDGDAGEAFAAIAGACLRQFRLNETLLLAGEADALPLHQARVGLRRLRSAFSLFKPLLRADAQAGRFAAALKDVAGLLGDVRDLEVLMARRDESLAAPLGAARAAAFEKARQRLEEPATRHLMLDLAEWLAVGKWRAGAPAHEEVTPFAAALLERRRKRLKRRGKHLAKLDDEARHRVRIEAKKLRYAAEFFAGLWRGKKARRRRSAFADAVEEVQDELGRLNDAAHGATVLARLGLVADWREPIDVADVLAHAEDALERLMEVKRFWR